MLKIKTLHLCDSSTAFKRQLRKIILKQTIMFFLLPCLASHISIRVHIYLMPYGPE